MGLDMYAYTVDLDALTAEQGEQGIDIPIYAIKDKFPGSVDTEFAYWRKFNPLHGWMRRLYERKGGTGSFNCDTVRLTSGDLLELRLDALRHDMPPEGGFFFGAEYEFSADDRREVLEFVDRALDAIEQGKAVFYDSWW